MDRILRERAGVEPGLQFGTTTYAYDPASRTTSLTDPVGNVTSWTYDAAGRVATEVDPLGKVTTYARDLVGNLTRKTDRLGRVVQYGYDADDRVTTETWVGSSPAETVTMTYDAAGRLTQVQDAKSKYTYTYDNANRLLTVDDDGTTGLPQVTLTYGYDPAGNRTSLDDSSGSSTDTVTYGYTDDGQLTGAAHANGSFADETFSYDANGNRDSTGYTTGAGNRISSDGVYTYAYDDEGNQTSRTEISTGDQTLYTWDHRNRLTEVDSKVGGATTVLAAYTYDALDRRIGVSEGATTTWTLYDGPAPVLDFNAAGTRTARYLDGPTPAGVDAVLAREISGATAWYLGDRLGTVRDLVNNSGAVIDRVEYNTYGGTVSETAPSAGDRYVSFAGLVRDITVGLNLAVYRVMDPATGRWLSEDPAGFKGRDANLSRYCSNSPDCFIDPLGTWAIPGLTTIGLVGLGGLLGGAGGAGGEFLKLFYYTITGDCYEANFTVAFWGGAASGAVVGLAAGGAADPLGAFAVGGAIRTGVTYVASGAAGGFVGGYLTTPPPTLNCSVHGSNPGKSTIGSPGPFGSYPGLP